MTAPAPPPGGPGQAITVSPENVLQVRKIIGQAVDAALTELGYLRTQMMVIPAAEDDISTSAATAWNKNLLMRPDSHFARLHQYVQSVRQLADQLGETAKQYGFTDEEIAESFKFSEVH